MKTSQVDFRFPVVGFTADGDMWGWPDLDRLTKCGPRTLKRRLQDGMELVDSDGRCWKVLGVARVGRGEPLLSLSWLLTGAPQSRIEHDLEAMEPVTLAQVKARARASIQAHSDLWGDGEGEPEDEVRNRLAEVDGLASIGDLVETLALDTLEGE